MKLCFLVAAVAASLSAQLPVVPGSAELKPETVVAVVDGREVTLAEIRQVMAAAPPQLIQQLQANPQAALTNYYVLKYLAAEGEKRKLAEQSPLKEQLELARANAVAGYMVNQERDTFPVGSDAIDAYFQRNRSSYEQAHIKVIQISFKPPAPAPAAGTSAEALAEAAKQALEAARAGSARNEAAADVLARDIVKRIRDGAEFAKMV